MTDNTPTIRTADTPAVMDGLAARTGLADPMLAYDYYKSMLSVGMATLGGILTLGESVFGARIAPWQMGAAALPVAISCLLALQGKTDVVQVCQGAKPRLNSARLALRLVPAFFGMGLGIFLGFLLVSYADPHLAAPQR